MIKDIKKSLLIALWFVLITSPLVLLRVDYLEKTIEFRWINLLFIAIIGFFASWFWRKYQAGKKIATKKVVKETYNNESVIRKFFSKKSNIILFILLSMVILIFFPFVFSSYQTSIIITAMMYIILGLGLNIVVGMAGLLDLGYVAFYAVGAYSYALLNLYFQLNFWLALPIAGLLAAALGVLLGIPVLRLRGDYLAIVTLGFGEIIRLILENWGEVTKGPSGVPNIPKPSFFNQKLDFNESTIFLYFIVLGFLVATIIVVKRLKISRIGRAWIALREDEIACQIMGINTTKTKLTAFGLGAFFAGIVGVFFAAKSSFINPASFTFYESAIILSIVVLGGMGSILGVILAAALLVLLPEYLRFLSEYRMLIFGLLMVLMMVFRPEGLIRNVNYKYKP